MAEGLDGACWHWTNKRLKGARSREMRFRQGDKVTAIYFIETGRLRLDRRTFDGRTLIVGTAPAGEFFVEAALFADIFHCDAVATEPSWFRIYPKTTVLTTLRTDLASAMSFLALVSHQVVALRQHIELMKVRSAKERVTLYLDLNAGPDGHTVTPRGQLQDIASELQAVPVKPSTERSPASSGRVRSSALASASCSRDRLAINPTLH